MEVLIGLLFCVEGRSGHAVDAAIGETISEVGVGVNVLRSHYTVRSFDSHHLLNLPRTISRHDRAGSAVKQPIVGRVNADTAHGCPPQGPVKMPRLGLIVSLEVHDLVVASSYEDSRHVEAKYSIL
jgi:hypothetical protein